MGLLLQACFVIILHFAAVWITIAVAFFRWICVRWPLSGNRLCSLGNARLAIGIIVVAALLTNIPNVLCNSIAERPFADPQNNRTLYSVGIHDRCDVGTFLRDLNGALLAFGIRFVPSIALTALTLLLLNEMRKVNARFLKLRVSNTRVSNAASTQIAIVVADASGSRSSLICSTEERGRQYNGGRQAPPRKSQSFVQPPVPLELPNYLSLPTPNQHMRGSISVTGSIASLGAGTISTPLSTANPSPRHSLCGIGIDMHIESSAGRGPGAEQVSTFSIGTRNVRFAGGAIVESPRLCNVESRRLRESNRTTRMLLWVVAMFLLVEFPQGVLHVASSADHIFEICGYAKLGDLLDLETLLMNTAKVCTNFLSRCECTDMRVR